ncbi:MAG: hypothetical protein IGS48_09405 [Oscillatoriales cyanobacterium C42_A2020_001]|nr:hypothetical protein [Leptolyngbyaceae cyanobacterium C42_A2020_001]
MNSVAISSSIFSGSNSTNYFQKHEPGRCQASLPLIHLTATTRLNQKFEAAQQKAEAVYANVGEA